MDDRADIAVGEDIAGDIGMEPPQAGQCRRTPRHQLAGLASGLLGDRLTKEGLGKQAACRQLQIELDDTQKLTHLGTLKGVRRIQSRFRPSLFNIIENHLRLTQGAAILDLKTRNLAHGTALEVTVRGSGTSVDFRELDSLFKERQLDHIVVVAEPESVELEHESLLRAKPCGSRHDSDAPAQSPSANQALSRH